MPLLERRGFLQTVERRVDLDRSELAACVVQLFRLCQALRIEAAAPRREVPAAYPNENIAGCGFGHGASLARVAGQFIADTSAGARKFQASFFHEISQVALRRRRACPGKACILLVRHSSDKTLR